MKKHSSCTGKATIRTGWSRPSSMKSANTSGASGGGSCARCVFLGFRLQIRPVGRRCQRDPPRRNHRAHRRHGTRGRQAVLSGNPGAPGPAHATPGRRRRTGRGLIAPCNAGAGRPRFAPPSYRGGWPAGLDSPAPCIPSSNRPPRWPASFPRPHAASCRGPRRPPGATPGGRPPCCPRWCCCMCWY